MSSPLNVNDFLNLITSEHRDKSKFISVLTALLTPIGNVSTLNHNMSKIMNLDTATGDVLDKIGSIIGLSRYLNFTPTNASPVLTDSYYRIILKARIAKNQWKGTKHDFYALWGVIFPDNPIILWDQQDMSAQVLVIGLNDTLSQELIIHDYIVPRSAGVHYNYGFINQPAFAYDFDQTYLKGWDLGYWLNLTE